MDHLMDHPDIVLIRNHRSPAPHCVLEYVRGGGLRLDHVRALTGTGIEGHLSQR